MTSTVEQVIEQLQRFNPLARVVPDLEIQGVSPATECMVDFSSEAMEAQQEEIDGLERQLEEMAKELEAAKEDIKRINTLCLYGPEKDKDLTAAILKITVNYPE